MSIHNTFLQSIAGQWQDGSGQLKVTVTNPATAEPIATYTAPSADDMARALQATVDGFDAWRQRTALERAQVLWRVAQLLRERVPAIARTLTLEQGKLLLESSREIEQAAQMIEWYGEEGRRACGQTIPSRFPGTRFHTLRLPIGPVAAFTPWNFPILLSAIKVAAALAAGCSVILKPAEETPMAVAEMVKCFHQAGVPGAALQMLVGAPADISATLIASAAIRKVSFTGSQQVGRLLAQQAGRALKPITLELGGHAPVIVCEDADVSAAVATLSQIKLRNAGQICANPSRFLVHRSRYDVFVQAFAAVAQATRVGDGLDAQHTMGPLATERRLLAVDGLVQRSVAQGARLVCGGERLGERGYFYAPTVLADVPLHADVMHEEPFGPLIPIVPFDTLDEAIAIANSLDVGLAAFGFTQHLPSARRITEEVRCGAVAINTISLMQPETPFGGVMDSGFGRENGLQGIDAYLSTRAVALA
jgi:succinate-semialdehyde dehydrogenase / glutarate-semialdehyde dehydrogenase